MASKPFEIWFKLNLISGTFFLACTLYVHRYLFLERKAVASLEK